MFFDFSLWFCLSCPSVFLLLLAKTIYLPRSSFLAFLSLLWVLFRHLSFLTTSFSFYFTLFLLSKPLSFHIRSFSPPLSYYSPFLPSPFLYLPFPLSPSPSPHFPFPCFLPSLSPFIYNFLPLLYMYLLSSPPPASYPLSLPLSITSFLSYTVSVFFPSPFPSRCSSVRQCIVYTVVYSVYVRPWLAC